MVSMGVVYSICRSSNYWLCGDVVSIYGRQGVGEMKASQGLGIIMGALVGLVYVITGDKFLQVMGVLLSVTAIGVIGMICAVLFSRVLDKELVK